MNGWGHVWQKVEEIRSRYLVGDLAHLPVDVLTLAEIELRLDIVPFDDLWIKYRRDAALMHDFTGIYVDAENYDLLERGPLWKHRRLRFSLAHEIGHFILHREIAAGLNFTSFDAFAQWTNASNGPQRTLELEADEFAGRLLVPPMRLQGEMESFAPRLKDAMPHWFTNPAVRSAFAESMTQVFEVCAQSIEIRLDREGIWPPC